MVTFKTALLLAISFFVSGCANTLRSQEEVCGQIRADIQVAATALENAVTTQNCHQVCDDMQTHIKKYWELQRRVSSECPAAYDWLNSFLRDIMAASAENCCCSDWNAQSLPRLVPDNGPPPMIRQRQHL